MLIRELERSLPPSDTCLPSRVTLPTEPELPLDVSPGFPPYRGSHVYPGPVLPGRVGTDCWGSFVVGITNICLQRICRTQEPLRALALEIDGLGEPQLFCF